METISTKNKISEPAYIAFFDLDRTLISENSGKSIVRFSYEKGLMSKKDYYKGIYLSILYKLRLRDPRKIIISMLAWLKGVSNERFEDFSSQEFKKVLINSVHKEAIPEIEFHKKNNGRVVILSSAILPVCAIIASHLGIDDIICSRLEIKDGKYTGRKDGPLCYGEEKLRQMISYCNTSNTNPMDCWYYGDSHSDLAVMTEVGKPVCVNPDKRLEKVARERNWKIYRWSLAQE